MTGVSISKVGQMVKRMKPEDLDRLIRGSEEEGAR